MKINLKRVWLFIPIAVVGLFILIIKLHTGYSAPCFFHSVTGLYCPGCGVTRMFVSLWKLEFYQAFRYNPLIFILLPFVFIMVSF